MKLTSFLWPLLPGLDIAMRFMQEHPSYGEMTHNASLKFQKFRGREGKKLLEFLFNEIQRPVGHDQRAKPLNRQNSAMDCLLCSGIGIIFDHETHDVP